MIEVFYHDHGIAITYPSADPVGGATVLHIPVDDSAGVADALQAVADGGHGAELRSFAVAKYDGAALLSWEFEGTPRGVLLPFQTASDVAAAILRALDDRAALVLYDSDIQHADPDDFRR